MIEIIYCRGGDLHAPTIAASAGMRYGTRYDYTPYDDVYFVDAGFGETVNWPETLARVHEWKPILSLVPDYFHRDELPTLRQRIDDLRALDVIPLVCPKFHGAVVDIPLDCRVAISVPAREYAGFLPYNSEVVGREIHLLGGSPAQQLYIMRHRYPHSRVVSVDGNKLAYKAQIGQIWHAQQARWFQMPARMFDNFSLQLYSAHHVVQYLRSPNSAIKTWQSSVRQCREVIPQLELFA